MKSRLLHLPSRRRLLSENSAHLKDESECKHVSEICLPVDYVTAKKKRGWKISMTARHRTY
jgi:hypothetical protein